MTPAPMLLIQYSKWFGPSRYAMDNPSDRAAPMESTVELVAYVTRLSLPDALVAVKNYEREFERAFGQFTAVEHTLFGVQTLPEALSRDDIETANIFLIEEMANNLADEPSWREKVTP